MSLLQSLVSQVIESFPFVLSSSIEAFFFILYSICSTEETYIFGLRLMPTSFLRFSIKNLTLFFVRKYLQNCFPENKSCFSKERKTFFFLALV